MGVQGVITVRIIAAGTIKSSERYFSDACAEYVKRLGRFCRVETVELPEDAPPREFIRRMGAKAARIALCVEGRTASSAGFADMIGAAAREGGSEIDFVIGGPDGLDEEVKSACGTRLSFSPMTFPHRLMRVILLEQVYRAFTILNGMKYDR